MGAPIQPHRGSTRQGRVLLWTTWGQVPPAPSALVLPPAPIPRGYAESCRLRSSGAGPVRRWTSCGQRRRSPPPERARGPLPGVGVAAHGAPAAPLRARRTDAQQPARRATEWPLPRVHPADADSAVGRHGRSSAAECAGSVVETCPGGPSGRRAASVIAAVTGRAPASPLRVAMRPRPRLRRRPETDSGVSRETLVGSLGGGQTRSVPARRVVTRSPWSSPGPAMSRCSVARASRPEGVPFHVKHDGGAHRPAYRSPRHRGRGVPVHPGGGSRAPGRCSDELSGLDRDAPPAGLGRPRAGACSLRRRRPSPGAAASAQPPPPSP